MLARKTLIVAVLIWSCHTVFAECAQRVDMATYAACLPKGWVFFRDAALDRLSGCSKLSGKCTGNGGGYPLRGAVFIFLMPADKVTDHPPYRSPDDIVSAAPHGGRPAPDIGEVRLIGQGKRCLVARSLLFGRVWDEVYGVEVNGRLFRAWVQYNNEPGSIDKYRRQIEGILSSLIPRSADLDRK